MALGRSNLPLACDPMSPSGLPVSSMGSKTGDQLISELLRYSRPQFPTHPSDSQNFMDHVVKVARILTGATGSAIALREEQGTICRARCGLGAPPVGAAVDMSSGISKECLDSGVPLHCDDITTNNRVDSEVSLSTGIRAVAVVPIYSAGSTSGILGVFSSVPGSFTDQHLWRLQQLASWVGSAVHTFEQKPTYGSNVDAPMTQSAAASDLRGEWKDIFVPSHTPWKRFFQSVFLHVAVIAIFSGVSRIYPAEVLVFQPRILDVQVTYYPPQSYPARESSPPAIRRRQKMPLRTEINAGRREADHSVGSDERAADRVVAARELSSSPPGMPVLAVSRARESGLDSVPPVGPPPNINAANARRPALPGSAVVGPAPELGSGSGLRDLPASNFTVVSPSPELPMSTGRTGQISTESRGSAGAFAVSVVLPPPSMNGRPLLTYGASGISSQPNGQGVVGPPPVIPGVARYGQASGSAGPGSGVSQVVPPPPALEGSNSAGGGRGRAGSFDTGGSQVVPPPPTMQNRERYGGAGGFASLGRGDAQVVPPPPSVPIGMQGNPGGRGTGNSLTRSDVEAVSPPPPSRGLAFNSKAELARNVRDAKPASPAEEATGGTINSITQEMPLRVIGLAWAPARSSYFSNFEVFVAEKWLNKSQTQFIKLVYVFLPYQRRLSEYGFDSKVRKLRVTRDPTCDESLMQIAVAGGAGANGSPANGLAAISQDRDTVLPCYRTTADDYQRAVARKR